jgi:predicted nucleic acid-binding protein
MIHSEKITAVLDTNVIYPAIVRDVLFWFAHYELFIPKWSVHIFDEWKSVMERKGVASEIAEKRVQVANLAFPDALVSNYHYLLSTVTLPDSKDCHVLAAAIKINANAIVTNNLKDFPADYLAEFGLVAKSADDFLTDIIDLNQQQALNAFREMVLHKKNPELSVYQVLEILRKSGLNDTANYLHSLL